MFFMTKFLRFGSSQFKLTLAAGGYVILFDKVCSKCHDYLDLIVIYLMKRGYSKMSKLRNVELRNLRKVLLFIRNFFDKQYKKIFNISVKRLQSAVPRKSIFFTSHSVNLSLFMESLKTFRVESKLHFSEKYKVVFPHSAHRRCFVLPI